MEGDAATGERTGAGSRNPSLPALLLYKVL